MAAPAKTEVLQALLDTQKLAGDLFDAVDSDTLRIDRRLINNLGVLVSALSALHRQMLLEYALSGAAGDDFLADMRRSLGADR